MRIACEVRSDDGPTHAVVDLTEEEAGRLLGYRPLFGIAVNYDEHLYCLEFFHPNVRFGDLTSPDGDHVDIADGWVRLPLVDAREEADTADVPTLQSERVDVACLRVTRDGVLWTCSPRHSDASIETPLILWESLEAVCAAKLTPEMFPPLDAAAAPGRDDARADLARWRAAGATLAKGGDAIDDRVDAACAAAFHKSIDVSYSAYPTDPADDEPLDNLDAVAVPGRVAFVSSDNEVRWGGGKPYRSPVVENPTWLQVCVYANAMIQRTKDRHHVFLEGVDKVRTEDGVDVYEFSMGS